MNRYKNTFEITVVDIQKVIQNNIQNDTVNYTKDLFKITGQIYIQQIYTLQD